MSKLINRGDTAKFVSLSLPAFSSLAHSTDVDITINHDAQVIKAGEKVITATRSSETTLSDNFNQAEVNQFIMPRDFAANMHAYFLNVNTVAIFTSDTSDEEIREKARLWCSQVIEIMTGEVNKITQNLSQIADLSSNADALFTQQTGQ